MNLNTLQEAVEHFSVPQNAIDYMIRLRWPDGAVTCPNCGSTAVTWMPTRTLFQCKGNHPKRQFSVKVGTIFEDSPISLGKRLIVAWMLGNCRNGISSYEVARTIGITQKSAWFMLHRLRTAAQDDSGKLYGEVEADETFIGGRIKNMHERKRPKGSGFSGKMSGAQGKTIVAGMLERGGEVRAQVVPERGRDILHPLITGNIEPGSALITDEWGGYSGLDRHYIHVVVNHAVEYVNGSIHVNGIENFWSLLKRCIKGTYVQVSPEHLQGYVAEQVFRFNSRKRLNVTEEQRFAKLLTGTPGKRLTYKELISR